MPAREPKTANERLCRKVTCALFFSPEPITHQPPHHVANNISDPVLYILLEFLKP